MADVFYRVATQVKTTAGINKYYIDPIELEELIDAISKPKNKPELKALVKALFTKKELAELIRRWLVARMIDNDLSYADIYESTGMSANTVADISRRLESEDEILTKILDRTAHLRNRDEQRRVKEARLAETPNPIDRKFRRLVDPFYDG